MAGHVTSGSSSVVTGQTVTAQVTLDLAPPIPRAENVDEFIVNGTNYNKDTQQFLQVVGVSPNASIELAHRAGATGSTGFNWIYPVHATQQLWSGNQGTRFYVQFIDYVSYGGDRPLVTIEFGYDSTTGKGMVEISDEHAVVGSVQVTGYIPAGATLELQSTLGGWIVRYNGSQIASGFWPSDSVSPFKIKYGTYKLASGTSSITWPSGHPAYSAAYPGWIFSEATLQNTWKPFAPTWTLQALNASNVQIGTNYNPSSISESSDIPIANFVVPAVAGIAKVRIRAQFHNLNTSLLGTPFLDIPVTTGGSTPLVVNGANPVTLNPGQQYTVTANYSTAELTFAALGGGSFGTGATANVYTAPTDAGTSATYQFRVTRTATAEVVTVGVNVPLKITPDIVSMIGGAIQTFTTNGDILTWTQSAGSLSGSGARSRTYTAPATVGTQTVTATTSTGSSVIATITVTSTGTTPTTGLRLEPAAGLSVGLNSQAQVRLIGDPTPALWATTQNTTIDSSTGDIKIISNSATAESTLAQALGGTTFGDPTATFTWEFNSTNQAVAGDLPQYVWAFKSASQSTLGTLILGYNGSGESWSVDLWQGSTRIASLPFTRTNTTGIKLTISYTSQVTIRAEYRPNNAASYILIGDAAFTLANPPRFLALQFNPSVPSKPSNSIVISKPVLSSSGFGRWYPPQWAAARIDAGGNVIGSYTVTASEESTVTSGNAAQVATVNCNAVGTARVSASYPSGIAAQNTVIITITQAGGALAVTPPAAGTTTNLSPGQTLTIEANDTPSALTYGGSGGTFGSGANKNVYTAGTVAGLYTITVSRGSEVITRNIRVLMTVTPPTQSIALNTTVTLTVNTLEPLTVSATGGTAVVFAQSGNNQLVSYTAPNTPGTYTVNVTSSINNASASVTAVSSGTTPIVISNAEPLQVEPNGHVLITSNYPVAECTYSATGGVFAADLPRKENDWRAPGLAGDYTITVTHPTGGSDTITATVYLRISPKNPPGVAPGQQIQFSANYSPITFFISSPDGGTVTTGGLWTAGQTGGSYTVTAHAVINSTVREDWSTVTVQGIGLALNVPSSVTLLPGQTLTITANFPTSELTFSATGGTFGTGGTANVYTAPFNAGGYTITVTRGTQTANVAVTVPVVIAPATTSVGNLSVVSYSVNADVVNFATTGWSATGGTLSAKAIRSATYTAGATAGTYQATAITTLGTVTGAITNTGTAGVPITITGAAAVTLEPASTYLIETNKPVGSYSLAATGGTFEGNQYRAPNQAGTYTITATDTSGSGAGADTLQVTVPLRVTPANSVVLPGQTQQYAVNYPASQTSWSTTPATLITAFGFWTAPFEQGTYTIRATTTIGDATTSATVQTVELIVYGSDHITLEPGAQYTVLTNLPPRAPSYSAFGGSFAANIYTAPTAAGLYHFTVTYQGQSKRVDVTVPLRIAPKEARVEAGQSQQFTINAPSATWSVTGGGTISQTGFYTAPTSGGTVARVTATTPNGSDTAVVLLLDEFPFQPTYAVDGEKGRTAVIVEAEDGTRFGRIKGASRRRYDLRFENRSQTETLAAIAFHTARYPEVPFLFHDIKLNDFVAVLFDSPIKWQVSGECRFHYSFKLLEE